MSVTQKKNTKTVKKGRAPRKTKVTKTHVVFVLDDSGSMQGIAEPARESFNRSLQDVKRNALLSKQPTTVSVWLFGTSILQLGATVAADKIQEIETFSPNQGGTKLNDAVYEVLVKAGDPADTATLLIVVTDGGENASNRSSEDVVELIASRTARTTATFMVPPGRRHEVATKYDVPIGNVVEWEQTTRGVAASTVHRTQAIGNYYTARAGGQAMTRGFYETTMAGVTPTQVRRQLDDISGDVKVWEVPAEVRIDDFVAAKGHAYLPGRAFYELTKREKVVQGNKEILIMERGKRAVYAGEQARELIGLPADKNASVTPGNHAGYHIFVQSKSVNRKLVRGTKLIYRIS